MKLHALILTTAIVATGAVSYASAPAYDALFADVPQKADRLEVPKEHGTSYVIIKSEGDGMTILSKIRVDGGAFERAATDLSGNVVAQLATGGRS
jgi:hypothetical protein